MASIDSNIPNSDGELKVTFEQFLDRFPTSPRKRYKNGWYVICPVHADQDPSLLIQPSSNPDFSVDFKCWTGCTNEAILKSVSLTWDNIRTHQNGRNPQSEPHKEIEAIYDYKQEAKLIFQVIRTNPKGFYQRRPDGKGDFINNLEGVKPFLYHYDDILLAIEKGKAIYIPEGEKDADSLWDRGLIGTTNPMGAGPGKWLESYTEFLKGADVVILEDNDKTGIDFAQQKLKSLYGKVASLKLVELPGVSASVKDITDWFNAGHTADELLELTRSTPEWTPDYETTKHLICLDNVQSKAVEWIVKPYIPKGKLTLLEGDPEVGKSHVALAIGTACTRGAKIWNMEFPRGKVLLLSAEDGMADTVKPRLEQLEADCKMIFTPKEIFTLDDAGIDLLGRYVKSFSPILIIIDPIMAYLDTKVNIHMANQVRHVMAGLATLAEQNNLAILALRHLTKSGTGKAIYRGLGSIDFAAAARSILFAFQDENTKERALIHTKCNLALHGESIGYEITDQGLRWTGKSEMTYKDVSLENGTALEDAKAWLEQTLQDGDKESEIIFKQGHELYNLSPSTLNRAKKLLNIESYSKPELGKKGAGKWYWHLPGVENNG